MSPVPLKVTDCRLTSTEIQVSRAVRAFLDLLFLDHNLPPSDQEVIGLFIVKRRAIVTSLELSTLATK